MSTKENNEVKKMELSKKAMSIKPSTTMAISSRAAEMKAAGVDVVSFGAGEPDFDTPAHIAQAGIDAIQNGQTRYTPAAGTPELRQAVCDKLKRDNGLEYEPAQVVISNGAKHSLMNTFMAILHEGDEVIIPAPFWLSYAEMVRIAGGVPVIIHTKKENGFMMTKEELENAYSAKTKAVVLTPPSNPTGQVMSRADLEMVAEFAVSHDILVVSDEIYEKLIYEDDKQHISIASLGQDIYDRTIVINGVSKSYAMTGWRIGYAAAPLPIAKLIGPQDCVAEMCVEFKKRRDYIYEREEAIPGISALKPEGAFYLFVDVSGLYGKAYEGQKIESAADFASILLEKKYVAVVPCADFGMPDYIRLSYATSMELIKKGMDRIEEMVKELK